MIRDKGVSRTKSFPLPHRGSQGAAEPLISPWLRNQVFQTTSDAGSVSSAGGCTGLRLRLGTTIGSDAATVQNT